MSLDMDYALREPEERERLQTLSDENCTFQPHLISPLKGHRKESILASVPQGRKHHEISGARVGGHGLLVYDQMTHIKEGKLERKQRIDRENELIRKKIEKKNLIARKNVNKQMRDYARRVKNREEQLVRQAVRLTANSPFKVDFNEQVSIKASIREEREKRNKEVKSYKQSMKGMRGTPEFDPCSAKTLKKKPTLDSPLNCLAMEYRDISRDLAEVYNEHYQLNKFQRQECQRAERFFPEVAMQVDSTYRSRSAYASDYSRSIATDK
jgi:hypothetical protein